MDALLLPWQHRLGDLTALSAQDSTVSVDHTFFPWASNIKHLLRSTFTLTLSGRSGDLPKSISHAGTKLLGKSSYFKIHLLYIN